MAEEREMKQAKVAFSTLCEMLDDRKWHYRRDDEKLTISCGVNGDDIAINVVMKIDPDKQLLVFYSTMPFEAPEGRRDEMAVAVSRANWGMIDGSFDFNYLNGKIIFRLTSSIRESLVGKDMFAYVLDVAVGTVDEYNDKFEKVANGNMSIDEVIKFIE